MKVVYVIEGFPPARIGGAEISTLEMATMVGQGNEVVVFTPSYGKPTGFEDAHAFQVFRYPNRFFPAGSLVQQKTFFFLEMAKHLAEFVRKFRPDIIHAQNLLSAPAVAKVAETHKIVGIAHVRDHRFECFTSRLACMSHSDATLLDFARCVDRRIHILAYPYAKLITRTIRLALTRCGKAITVSHYLRNELLQAMPLDVRTSYIGVDVKKFERIESMKSLVSLGRILEETDKTIIYAGGMHRVKGIFELLDGFLQVCRKVKDALLLVAGDGPDRRGVCRFIESHNLRRNVVLLGTIPHQTMLEVLKASKLVVVPSLLPEAGSRSTVEALACGKPVIGSNRGCIPEIVGAAGEIVDPHGDNISRAILNLLEDRERLERLSALARARSQVFDIRRTTAEVVSFYEEWLRS